MIETTSSNETNDVAKVILRGVSNKVNRVTTLITKVVSAACLRHDLPHDDDDLYGCQGKLLPDASSPYHHQLLGPLAGLILRVESE